MTEFQYSAIKALATSTDAYKAFRLSAKNRKALDQYMNRVWPYKAANSIVETIDYDSLESRLSRLMRTNKINLSDMVDNYNEYGKGDKGPFWGKGPFWFTLTLNQSILVAEMPSNEEEKRRESTLLKSFSKGDINVVITCNGEFMKRIYKPLHTYRRRSGAKIEAVSDPIRMARDMAMNELSDFFGVKVNKKKSRNGVVSYIDRKYIDMYEISIEIRVEHNLDGGKRRIKSAVKMLKRNAMENMAYMDMDLKTKTQKRMRLRSGQNVGIEIEYEGPYMAIRRKILSLGAISFECGVDGSSGEKVESYSFLREARLRLNGMYSLKALEFLLDYMIKHGCRHTNRSSIHYHIDARKIDENARYYVNTMSKPKMQDEVRSALMDASSEKVKDAIMQIFEIDLPEWRIKCREPDVVFTKEIMDSIRISRYGTIEFRFGSRTLIYSKVILQILASIHIANSARYKNKKINDEYIIKLGEIAEELY